MEPELHTAVASGDIEKVSQVLKTSDGTKNLNKEYNGEFPIHIAAKTRNLKIVELLANMGANINQGIEQVGSMQGYTATHLAARNGDIDMIALLKKLGGDISRRGADGWYPIHCAAFASKCQAVMALVDAGADINVTNSHGHTPLVYAANHGRLSDVKEFVKRGASTDIVDNSGDSLMHHVFHYQMSKLFEGNYDVPDAQLDVAVYLAICGVDVEIKNTDGNSALHYWGEEIPHLESVLKILKHNGSLFKKSKTEWNYLTLVAARIDHFIAMEMDPKHSMDLVEMLKFTEQERVDEKKRREQNRPAGGCPVMRGKKNNKGAEHVSKDNDNADACHSNIDISKMDPNGPDPSNGQCPFFKKSSAVSESDKSRTNTVLQKQPENNSTISTSNTTDDVSIFSRLMAFIQNNQLQILQILLAFFVGIWFEQTMSRLLR